MNQDGARRLLFLSDIGESVKSVSIPLPAVTRALSLKGRRHGPSAALLWRKIGHSCLLT